MTQNIIVSLAKIAYHRRFAVREEDLMTVQVTKALRSQRRRMNKTMKWRQVR